MTVDIFVIMSYKSNEQVDLRDLTPIFFSPELLVEYFNFKKYDLSSVMLSKIWGIVFL